MTGAAFTLSLFMVAISAAAAQPPLQTPDYAFDKATLREGAVLYAQYCLSCHSLRYLRYTRVARDLNMSKSQVKSKLMLPDGATFDKGMLDTLNPQDAKQWFGITPPDLTLEARYRGADWIYTYLHSFYLDSSRPTGWNNHLFPNVSMPNVLAAESGQRDANGNVITKGTVSPAQYDHIVAAITAWLQYTSDPSIIGRRALGPYVLGFVAVFSLLAFMLKRAYWRDVE